MDKLRFPIAILILKLIAFFVPIGGEKRHWGQCQLDAGELMLLPICIMGIAGFQKESELRKV
jgi:hypothetical protein